MKSQKIKAILFDKDGVLLNFQATYGNATREIIQRLSKGDETLFNMLANDIGFDPVTNYIDPASPLVGGCAYDICAVWAAGIGVENSLEFQASVDEMFQQLTENGAVMIEGVNTILPWLGKTYQLGLATNDMEACARAQLSNLGILQNFGFISGYNSGHGPKPEPGMAKAFFKYTNLNPENVVMVGDSIHDMHFATASGMTSVGVSTGPLPADLLAPHADHLLSSLAELPGLLARL